LVREIGVPLRKLSGGELSKIINAPQAQRRTAKFKKSVYVVDELVFKGPYSLDDSALINSIRHTHALGLLENALHMPEWRKGSLPWEFLGVSPDDQCYLIAPNVGRWRNMSFETVTTKIEKDVKVVPRRSHLMRVSDIEGTDQLTNQIKMATLQHLYLRFLLGIGDSGTHNVLVRKDHDRSGRVIAGVDLDERRRESRMRLRLDCLFKKSPSKKQVQLYQSSVPNIMSLSYRDIDHHTTEQLELIGIDLDRLTENMKLWEALS
jgi:hypothetical protein